jgi:hypothetical protein
LITTIACASALAGQKSYVPYSINYQGFLANSSDTTPFTGNVKLEYIIIDDASGTPVWSETLDTVQVNRGYFNVELGNQFSNPFNPIIYSDPMYYQIKINDELLEPYKPIGSVLYAHQARRADTLVGMQGAANVSAPEIGDVLTWSGANWVNHRTSIAGRITGAPGSLLNQAMPRLPGATAANTTVVASGCKIYFDVRTPIALKGTVQNDTTISFEAWDINGSPYDFDPSYWTGIEINYIVSLSW